MNLSKSMSLAYANNYYKSTDVFLTVADAEAEIATAVERERERIKRAYYAARYGHMAAEAFDLAIQPTAQKPGRIERLEPSDYPGNENLARVVNQIADRLNAEHKE